MGCKDATYRSFRVPARYRERCTGQSSVVNEEEQFPLRGEGRKSKSEEVKGQRSNEKNDPTNG